MSQEPDAVALLMDQFPDGHPAADELIGLRSACHKLKVERNELRAEVERLRAQLARYEPLRMDTLRASGEK